MQKLRIVISGGGTGGHIFPAISIANAIRQLRPEAELLFVGAEGRMEMERVPQAGYEIVGLPVSGFDRKHLWRNIAVLYRAWKSQRMARKIAKRFQPQVAVGVGGYASGPMLNACAKLGIPCVIQEQNSYAGVTNRLLAKKASKICVAYDGMERFFPKEKLLKTGNPVRQALLGCTLSVADARRSLGLNPQRRTILIVGGSLGAKTLNESVLQHILALRQANAQVIWQTGRYYHAAIMERLTAMGGADNLVVKDFIADMAAAYRAADLVVSRAGASSISELCLVGKPVILVPSPNVAEDHQTKNAMALVERGAAICVKDSEAVERLLPLAFDTVGNDTALQRLSSNILQLALPNSAITIAKEVLQLAEGTADAAADSSKSKTLNDNNKSKAINDSITHDAIYFLGIGGIGMSAIARYFLKAGAIVAGYDRTPTPLTEQLTAEGAAIHYDEDVEKIPAECRDPQRTLVVYTPAVPADHKELVYFREQGFRVMKRAEVLGVLTQRHKGLCVAGTHGKTTTSAMCAHIMRQSHLGCNAFLGGIAKNYGTNYLIDEKSDYVVIEADEYDRSFHHLAPHITVVTATDPDHLDIYGTKEAYLDSFRHYTSLIKAGGALIAHSGLEMTPDVKQGVAVYEYNGGATTGDSANATNAAATNVKANAAIQAPTPAFRAENIRIGNGEIVFDFVSPIENVSNVTLGQPVSVNIDNGVAAMAMAQLCGCTASELRQGMATFEGVDRRFDFKLRTPRIVLLSDYAHHPQEIRQSIKSVKELYGERTVTALFQPHLYTRTRDFYHEFADSLSLADEVVLCDIYPAREEPIEGVTSELIYRHLRAGMPKTMIRKADTLSYVRSRDFDVLMILGAGDLDDYMPQIADILTEKYL